MPLQPLLEGDARHIGEYRVLARLGAGGQGVVYLGEAPDGRRVAIKLLHPWFGGSPQGRRLFEREIRLAGRATGYTARVLGSGEQAGRPYVVSEYIEGESVEDRVRRAGPYGRAEVVALAAAIASALAAVHAAGLVHCDFKPGNVLTGPYGARIVDFGIARALETIAHRDHERRGTPAYMAPEQVTGGRLGPPTDVFAWGSTMAFAATGTPPFGHGDAENGHGTMYRIVNQEPDLGGVPEPLRAVVSACLRKDPADRPTASGVMSMLGQGGPAPSSGGPPVPSPFGVPIGDPLTGHTGTIRCVAYGSCGDLPLAVTGAHDRTARVWDLAARRRHGPPLRHDAPVLAVACREEAGLPIAVTGCQDGTLTVWDLAAGERVGEPLRGHGGAVTSVATAVVGGRTLAVSASDDRTARLWDLAAGRQIGSPLTDDASPMPVACGELDGSAVAIIGGMWDQSVRVLDLGDRRWTDLRLTSHTDSVVAVAYGRLAGRPVAVTGGYDRTVRVWDLGTRRELGSPLVHESAVLSVTFGMRGGEPILLVGGADGAVQGWSLPSRRSLGDPLAAGPSARGGAVPVAFGRIDGRPIAITCPEDLGVRLWSLGTP
ncbi:serine/threonine-protein kinase [Actinomadura sp. KC216]|uniref:WD40 repeat domain-containing serine/threonine protein kinase n=1 Tax=Actinomadura sp. KC216 TaxID=2530370 RepID=UPI00140476F4|nr:serine/threonine-protein kinase [Actinomadura sp. KC216]